MSTAIKARLNIYDLYQIKCDVLESHQRMEQEHNKIKSRLGEIDAYPFHDFGFDRNLGLYSENREIKAIDQKLWGYLFRLYELDKYMLCTEAEKVQTDIYECRFPEFTVENAEGWLLNLKATIYDSVQKLIERVFDEVTQGTYRTGGSSWYTSQKKKRNNNGIDNHFILTTHDNSRYYAKPTVTDDLEKACYILDGKTLPTDTIKGQLGYERIGYAENPYFRIRVCANGNTHYWLNDEIRRKLNLYGSRRGVIGEEIKIKVFEKEV